MRKGARRGLRSLAAAAGLLALAYAAAPANAQPTPAHSWPRTTVKLILPLGPGSATDVTARLFAERLAERWGRPVVVENRAGPDGLVAVAAFVSARDEHTLLFSIGGPLTINPIGAREPPLRPRPRPGADRAGVRFVPRDRGQFLARRHLDR